jgi:hypothetical protein
MSEVLKIRQEYGLRAAGILDKADLEYSITTTREGHKVIETNEEGMSLLLSKLPPECVTNLKNLTRYKEQASLAIHESAVEAYEKALKTSGVNDFKTVEDLTLYPFFAFIARGDQVELLRRQLPKGTYCSLEEARSLAIAEDFKAACTARREALGVESLPEAEAHAIIRELSAQVLAKLKQGR